MKFGFDFCDVDLTIPGKIEFGSDKVFVSGNIVIFDIIDGLHAVKIHGHDSYQYILMPVRMW